MAGAAAFTIAVAPLVWTHRFALHLSACDL